MEFKDLLDKQTLVSRTLHTKQQLVNQTTKTLDGTIKRRGVGVDDQGKPVMFQLFLNHSLTSIRHHGSSNIINLSSCNRLESVQSSVSKQLRILNTCSVLHLNRSYGTHLPYTSIVQYSCTLHS